MIFFYFAFLYHCEHTFSNLSVQYLNVYYIFYTTMLYKTIANKNIVQNTAENKFHMKKYLSSFVVIICAY